MKKQNSKMINAKEHKLSTSIKFTIVAIVLIAVFCVALTPITLQNDTYYTIKIGETEFTCENGNNIESYEIEGFEGKITCPPYNRICSGTKLCNDRFL